MIDHMGRIILVTGGARSGKSSYAEQLVSLMGERIIYLATARALDQEMEDRIAKHRQQRPSTWQTIETPTSLAAVIQAEGNGCDALLLDCLTVFLTNRILTYTVDWDHPDMGRLNAIEADLMDEVQAIVEAASRMQAQLVVVTNEVGFGIVPMSPLARFFRDCAGRANQRLAAAAAEVFLVVAGIPMRIKGV